MGDLLPEESGESTHGMALGPRAKAKAFIRRIDSCLLSYFERPGPRRVATETLRILLLIEAPIRWINKPAAWLLAGIEARERRRREKHFSQGGRK
ncbi:hypothetical protein HHS34_005315 [Acidithiobacillus montserratensis]|uniref:Uncharacterized protein n=1 Tax=Acidithiobacillus montserratensis TaxID=2729135 RepID=A0ACD5HKZ0_9PROT|nr:hypothetical protein [Acidithiobacillus montserratensis]MBU2746585.1 hypothetical protein [Acidithiobacillus montserratensis]